MLYEYQKENLPCQNSFPFPESSPETGRKHVKTLLLLNQESGWLHAQFETRTSRVIDKIIEIKTFLSGLKNEKQNSC